MTDFTFGNNHSCLTAFWWDRYLSGTYLDVCRKNSQDGLT